MKPLPSAFQLLRSTPGLCFLLAVLYAFTGRLSFLARVDDILVTPVLFIPEGIALAFALRFGARVWPGIFLGQLFLALPQGLALAPALAVSAINSLEAAGGVWLYRRLGGQTNLYDLRSWLCLQGLVFLILQPFSATCGTLTLAAVGIIRDFPEWVVSWQNWWIGNATAQSQLTPLLLLLLHHERSRGWVKKIFLPVGITATALWFTLSALPAGGIGTALVLFQPLLVGFGLALGLKSVCAASVLTSLGFLYATSHGLGPFYRGESTSLVDLNVFLIGISLIGQFLAVLFRQLEEARNKERALETRQRGEIERKLRTSLTAAGIAHEINQPLSQILLQTEVSLRKLPGTETAQGEIAEGFRKIRARTEEVVETIDTIRALLGNVATGHRELDWANVVRSALLYVLPTLQREGVEVQNTGLDQPCPLEGDESQLHLVAVNLLRNGLEAMKGSPIGKRSIRLSLRSSPKEAVLTVEDSGPGFSGDPQLRMDVPLESTKPEGMGMGLYLIRTAVDNHGGRISFDRSPVLGGARVEVSLPK